MNTRKFETISNINDYYLQINAPDDGNCDLIAERVVMNSCPDFLVPVNRLDINGVKIYRYNVGTNIVYKYFNHSFIAADFILLLKNMIRPLMICKDWFIDNGRFYLDPDYVFIDKKTMSVKYVYTFDKTFSCTDDDVKVFITDIVNEVNIIGNNSIQLDLYKYVLGRNFSLDGIWQLITDLEKRNPSDNSFSAENSNSEQMHAFEEPSHVKPVQVTVPAPSAIPEEEEIHVDSYSNDGNLDEDIAEMMQNISSDSSKKQQKKKSGGLFDKLFSKKENKQKTEPQEIRVEQEQLETVSSMPQSQRIEEYFSDYNDETVFSAFDYSEQNNGSASVMLELVSTKLNSMPRRIILDLSKGYITLGRKSADGRSRSDVELPLEAKKISRCHLRIEKNGDSYFAIDLGSANGTALNGEKMMPNRGVKLESDAVIAFANDFALYRFVIR